MSNVTVATEEPEEGNYGPFNKRLNKLMHKTRIENSKRSPFWLERRSQFYSSLPHAATGHYQ